MADFCKQCSIVAFGEDLGDLKDIAKDEELILALCEGCGPTAVNIDGECKGRCLEVQHQSEARC